jgi:hypothetical protein
MKRESLICVRDGAACRRFCIGSALGAAALCVAAVPALAQKAPVDQAAADELIRAREAQVRQLILIQQEFDPTIEDAEWPQFVEEDWRGVEVEPWVAQTVERLNDPAYEEREEATQYLIDGCADVQVLYRLLAQHELSAEQRERLLQVVQQHLLYRPRGALGINMDQVHFNREIPGEVRIDDLLPDLPAERVLRVDDRITHFNGELLTQRNDLIRRAQSHQPGDEVTLTVRRPRTDNQGRAMEGPDGEALFDVLEIKLALGSADKLIDPATGRPLRGGPVIQQRQMQAAQVALRFAAEPVRVEAANSEQEPFFSSTLRITAEMIEQHVEIQLLLRQLEVARTSPPELAENYREQWRLRLNYLRDQAIAPEWSDLDREFFQRLSDRYSELVAPELE